MPALKKQSDLCIFFVLTEREIESGEFEDCIFEYLDKAPSREFMSDVFIFANKITCTKKIKTLSRVIEANRFVRSINFINLNLTQEIDCFWYPWSFSQKIKPKEKPELGYTSGANILFYYAIEMMFETDYKDFLMLECDTKPMRNRWFDVVLDYCGKHDFEIAGSTYKGNAQWHSDSEYKDHINGVAIYRNSKASQSLIASSKKIVKRECEKEDYLNFDVANLIAKVESKRKKPFKLKNTNIIINLSDPSDQGWTDEDIFNKYSRATIVHQKKKKDSRILDLSIFERKYEESLPTYFCMPKCASEYVLSLNKEFLLEKASRSNKGYAILKISTELNSKLILFCESEYDFDLLPRSLFKEVNERVFYCDIKTFNDLIINNYISVFSIALDFRDGPADIDETAFYILKSVSERLQKSFHFYTFLRDPFLVLKSSFPAWENVNYRNEKADPQEKRRRFNLFSTLFPNMFLQKRLLGSSYDSSMQKKNHLYSILDNFQIYDVSLIEESTNHMFNYFHKISLDAGKKENFNINSTKNLYNIDKGTFLKAKVAQYNWGQKSIEDFEIYNNLAIKKIESNMDDIIKRAKKIDLTDKNVPVFFHIPKNAGTFIIATMNKYFLRILGIKNDDFNLQRLSVRTPTGHEIKIFVYFKDESWQEDEDIKIFDNFGKKVRARKCSLETFIKYFNAEKIKLLACVVEPVGEVLDLRSSFYKIWDILKSKGRKPVNFCIIRNPYDRASSIYNYLTSTESSHEKTHGSFDGLKDFRHYIQSHFMEDSWLIRAVTGAPINSPLGEGWMQAAKDFLLQNDFKIGDIKESGDLLEEILGYCYEEKLIDIDTKNINANKSKYKSEKVNFSDLNLKEREVFSSRAKWDINLYNKLLENN